MQMTGTRPAAPLQCCLLQIMIGIDLLDMQNASIEGQIIELDCRDAFLRVYGHKFTSCTFRIRIVETHHIQFVNCDLEDCFFVHTHPCTIKKYDGVYIHDCNIWSCMWTAYRSKAINSIVNCNIIYSDIYSRVVDAESCYWDISESTVSRRILCGLFTIRKSPGHAATSAWGASGALRRAPTVRPRIQNTAPSTSDTFVPERATFPRLIDEEVNNPLNESPCVICMTYLTNAVLECGHGLCSECAFSSAVKKCPLCKCPVGTIRPNWALHTTRNIRQTH